MDVGKFAASTLQLLQTDPANYRNFGPYWYFVKDVLKGFYTKDNLYLLGDYRDPDVIARMPDHESRDDALAAAAATYQFNAAYKHSNNQVEDAEGELFTLFDPDANL
jgi:hypothetical protein